MESRNEDLELPLFDLATLSDATNFFSINNKLGQGGFGPVYKVSTLRLLSAPWINLMLINQYQTWHQI